MKNRYRLAILNSHPVQYAAPLFRRLAKQPEIDLTVYFCSDQGATEYWDPDFGRSVQWDIPLLQGYTYQMLPNLRRSNRVAGFFSLINPTICNVLWRGAPDAVLICGYSYSTDILAFLAARLRGIPILYLSESSLSYDRNVRRPWYIRLTKPHFLRLLFRQVDAFLAIGTLNADFYRQHGVQAERIYPFPHAVDNNFFATQSALYQPQREALRRALGIGPKDIVFLFAAKMSALKRPIELLEAYSRAFSASPEGKALLMVGDGELRADAEAFIRNHGLKHVVLTGFANQSELPRYYAISDVFVRPDGIYRGDWGFTVNEAMACGLAVVATDKIGATVDLVRDCENGYVVPFGDSDALTAALRRAAANPAQIRYMGSRSAEIIRDWDFNSCTEGMLRALRSLQPHPTSIHSAGKEKTAQE